MAERIVDLGCGASKWPGAVGVDIVCAPGVDVVCDLNRPPWPLESNHFDRVVCRHVIEHVHDMVAFLGEIHRIAKPGAEVVFETPHYSSRDSWGDPEHRWHLATHWHVPLAEGSFLATRTGTFEHVATRVDFGKSVRALIPKAMTRLLGVYLWEKHYAFVYPAKNFTTVLRVMKLLWLALAPWAIAF